MLNIEVLNFFENLNPTKADETCPIFFYQHGYD